VSKLDLPAAVNALRLKAEQDSGAQRDGTLLGGRRSQPCHTIGRAICRRSKKAPCEPVLEKYFPSRWSRIDVNLGATEDVSFCALEALGDRPEDHHQAGEAAPL
jgi:hypothetical protein